MTQSLESLVPGMPIPFGGSRITHVSDELAAAFRPGDRLVVVQETGDLLHIPETDWEVAKEAVGRAFAAFSRLGTVTDDRISDFFETFADLLAAEAEAIRQANQEDVAGARERERSTTRLILTDQMLAEMISGLRGWAVRPGARSQVVETIPHQGWTTELIRSGLGVVGFVFEGRPNVFADATGVIRSGNAVVFRIGSDALGTARAIMTHALDPALAKTGLPPGTATLVDAQSRAAGWAMFSDRRLALAVARGSGRAVAQLGAVARQAGVPVSLHGTGGAWLIAAESADPAAFAAAVYHSLDRKVCNTLNTCLIVASAADRLLPAFLEALARAGSRRQTHPKLHILAGQEHHLPAAWSEPVEISRAEGLVTEPAAETLRPEGLAIEWEWEDSPEVSLGLVESVDEAVELFNAHSPRFIASLVSDDADEHRRFFETVDAPFVGNGFTRWVDGQYALDRPELGLSNWQAGRLLGRGGVLAGDSIFTIRTRALQADPELGR